MFVLNPASCYNYTSNINAKTRCGNSAPGDTDTIGDATVLQDNSTIPPKRCTRCEVEKPATTEFFNIDNSRRDRLAPWCKSCRRQTGTPRNPRKATPDGYKYCPKCETVKPLDDFAVDSKGSYGRHGHCRNCVSLSRSGKRAHFVATTRQWQLKNPELQAQYRKTYRLKHPNVTRASTHRYAARKRGLPHNFTAEDCQRAIDYFNGCCAVCSRPLFDLFGTHCVGMDHWIPLSSPNCPGTIPGNMIPLCHGVGGCNNRKHDNEPISWLEATYGKRKARLILERIENYFNSLK